MDSSVPRWKRGQELWAFFALAYGLTWAVHIPLALAAKGILDLHVPPALHFLGAAGTACWAPVRASSCQPTFTDKTLSFAFLSFA